MTDFDAIVKAAVGRQIKALGGVESAAALASMAKTQLSNYANQDRGERIPAIVALRLDEAAGHPLILNAMASLIGCRVVRAEAGGGEIMAALAEAAAQAGQLLSAGYAAAADGNFTTSERRGMVGDAVALIDKLNALLRAIGTEGE